MLGGYYPSPFHTSHSSSFGQQNHIRHHYPSPFVNNSISSHFQSPQHEMELQRRRRRAAYEAEMERLKREKYQAAIYQAEMERRQLLQARQQQEAQQRQRQQQQQQQQMMAAENEAGRNFIVRGNDGRLYRVKLSTKEDHMKQVDVPANNFPNKSSTSATWTPHSFHPTTSEEMKISIANPMEVTPYEQAAKIQQHHWNNNLMVDEEQQEETNEWGFIPPVSGTFVAPNGVLVEDVTEEELKNDELVSSIWRHRVPSEGQWIEPVFVN